MDNQENMLQFDIEELTDGNSGVPSLSDIYGIPVFTEKISTTSTQLAKDQAAKNKQMQQDLFLVKDESMKEVGIIKDKVFSTTVIAKDQGNNVENEETSTTFTVISIILFCFILSIGFFYTMKKNKERKEYLETIDNFF